MQEGQEKVKILQKAQSQSKLTKEGQIISNERRYFELNHKAVLGESTSEAFKPGSIFQVNDTICDQYLVSRENRNQIIGRPVLYIVLDVFSHYIVGFHSGLEGLSRLGTMMALYNATRNKVELCKEYGIEIDENEWNCSSLPDTLIVDRGALGNTESYNLVNNLGISVKIHPPYMTKCKGTVEQSFNKFNLVANRWQSTAVIKKDTIREDRDYRKDVLLNLDEFTRIIIHSILDFNNTHMDYYVRDEHMLPEDVARIPSVLWKWGLENRGSRLKSFSEDVIKLNLLPNAYACNHKGPYG
ncbi:MAG: hypothetical protein P4L59_00715 [Desulfosporosinus sp.]|nr:hypothetical protein [Desulfosporosinus sp.]